MQTVQLTEVVCCGMVCRYLEVCPTPVVTWHQLVTVCKHAQLDMHGEKLTRGVQPKLEAHLERK